MRPGVDPKQGAARENTEEHDDEDILANSVAGIRIRQHQIPILTRLSSDADPFVRERALAALAALRKR